MEGGRILISAKLSSAFRRYLISYLIILIIPNIAGYVSYRVSIDVAQSASIENGLMVLNQSKDILESRIAEVERFTRQLAINSELTKLISEEAEGGTYNVYGLWKMARDVADYSQTNNVLQNFYIYLNNYNVILGPNVAYLRPEHYYELNHYVGTPYEEWKTTILQKPHEHEIIPLRSFVKDKKEKSVLTIAQSLPLNSFDHPKATVVVLIDEHEISKLLEGVAFYYGGWALITDKDGNPLVTNNLGDLSMESIVSSPAEVTRQTNHFDGETLLITTRSEKTGWIYTAGIPKQALMIKANKIKYITWSLSAAAILVGLLIGLLLAYRNSAPINRLLNVFKDHIVVDNARVKDEFDLLTGNISNLIADNQLLQMELTKQMPMIKDAYIKRLLTGEYSTVQEIEAVGSQTGIQIGGKVGYVGMIRMIGYEGIDSKETIEELGVARFIINQELHRMEFPLTTTLLGSDKIALLVQSNAELDLIWRNKFENRLHQLIETVYANYRISVTLAMGGVYSNIIEIHKSFEEAIQAMDYAVYADHKEIVWFQDMMRESTMYNYPLDLEQRLLNTVKAGEAEESKRIITHIFERNFSERVLSYEMTEQLIVEMKGTLLKLLDQKVFQDADFSESIQNRILQIELTHGLEQVKNGLEKLIEEYCERIVKKKRDVHHETVNGIRCYIDSAFIDSDLTLYRIAEHVRRPEKYISQLFKEHTGENIFDYLERKRIDIASSLLAENHLSIDEIALQVGYNSAHSFRRAFKRVNGVSPSVYRQALKP